MMWFLCVQIVAGAMAAVPPGLALAGDLDSLIHQGDTALRHAVTYFGTDPQVASIWSPVEIRSAVERFTELHREVIGVKIKLIGGANFLGQVADVAQRLAQRAAALLRWYIAARDETRGALIVSDFLGQFVSIAEGIAKHASALPKPVPVGAKGTPFEVVASQLPSAVTVMNHILTESLGHAGHFARMALLCDASAASGQDYDTLWRLGLVRGQISAVQTAVHSLLQTVTQQLTP